MVLFVVLLYTTVWCGGMCCVVSLCVVLYCVALCIYVLHRVAVRRMVLCYIGYRYGVMYGVALL